LAVPLLAFGLACSPAVPDTTTPAAVADTSPAVAGSLTDADRARLGPYGVWNEEVKTALSGLTGHPTIRETQEACYDTKETLNQPPSLRFDDPVLRSATMAIAGSLWAQLEACAEGDIAESIVQGKVGEAANTRFAARLKAIG